MRLKPRKKRATPLQITTLSISPNTTTWRWFKWLGLWQKNPVLTSGVRGDSALKKMNSLLWPPDHWLFLLLFKTEKFHFAASWSLRESERSKLLQQQNRLSHQKTSFICVGFDSHLSAVLEVTGCSCPPLAGESHLEAKNPYTSGAYFNSTEHWNKATMKAALCLTVWTEGSRRAKGSSWGKRQVERAVDPPLAHQL